MGAYVGQSGYILGVQSEVIRPTLGQWETGSLYANGRAVMATAKALPRRGEGSPNCSRARNDAVSTLA